MWLYGHCPRTTSVFYPVAFNLRDGSSPETKVLNPDPPFHRKCHLFWVLVLFLAQQTSEGWVENALTPASWCLRLSPEKIDNGSLKTRCQYKTLLCSGPRHGKRQSSRNNQWLVTICFQDVPRACGCRGRQWKAALKLEGLGKGPFLLLSVCWYEMAEAGADMEVTEKGGGS